MTGVYKSLKWGTKQLSMHHLMCDSISVSKISLFYLFYYCRLHCNHKYIYEISRQDTKKVYCTKNVNFLSSFSMIFGIYGAPSLQKSRRGLRVWQSWIKLSQISFFLPWRPKEIRKVMCRFVSMCWCLQQQCNNNGESKNRGSSHFLNISLTLFRAPVSLSSSFSLIL